MWGWMSVRSGGRRDILVGLKTEVGCRHLRMKAALLITGPNHDSCGPEA